MNAAKLKCALVLAAVVCAASSGRLRAQEPPASVAAVCKAVRNKGYPSEGRPTLVQRDAVRGFASHHYYYGIGVKVDYVKARHAAFLELEDDLASMFDGDTILMMLYANGFGVKQDLDFATMLACKSGFAPAEIQGRVEHLQQLKHTREARPFDYCDDITSGYMMGFCEGLEEERKAAKRDRALTALSNSWPAEHIDALRMLKSAANAFIDARVNNEVDLSGTARGMLMTQEETRLRNGLLAALKRFERGQLPRFDAAKFKAADAELNEVYKRAVAHDQEGSTVTAEGIRTAERVWIRYRDAWVEFGKTRYPGVAAESWQTWLTRERTRQLREFVPAAP